MDPLINGNFQFERNILDRHIQTVIRTYLPENLTKTEKNLNGTYKHKFMQHPFAEIL